MFVSWPALTNNAWVKFWGVLIVFWLVTFSQFGGTKYTQKIAKFGFLIGILIPLHYYLFLPFGIYALAENY